MMKEIIKNIRYIGITQRGKYQSMTMYRGNYLLGIFIELLYIFIQLFFLSITIGKVGSIGEWSYGIILTSYGFFELVMGAFWMIFTKATQIPEGLAFDGEMDKYLTKPYSVLFQMTLGEIQLEYIPNVVLGFLIFINGLGRAGISMDFLLWGRFLIAMVSSILLLGGIFVSFCSLGFWLNDRLEIKAPLMQLMQMARYPTSIYSNSVAFIITWILPLAFVGFLPSLYILWDQRLRGLYQLLPMVSVVWFILSIIIWKIGIKKYTSVS